MNVLPFIVTSIFDTKVSFEAAALFVTWAAVTFLAIIAMHLHLRLQRLERVSTSVVEARPYGRFVGRRLDELLGGATFAIQPQLVVVLSRACKACDHMLSEIASPEWATPTVVLWTDPPPSTMPALPANTIVPANGSALAAKLSIAVTPFALWMNQEGEIVNASPVNSLGSQGVPLTARSGSKLRLTTLQFERIGR